MASLAAYDDVDRTICLTGPESTGKTTLGRALAAHLDVPLVPEIARQYLEGRTSYEPSDVLEIARRQIEAEREARATHRGLLLCDTDVLVIRIWWREKYGALPGLLARAAPEPGARGYLLLSPDLPWTPDPLRESPADRGRLFDLHVAELALARLPHRVVRGLRDDRLASALAHVESLVGAL